MSSFHLHFQLGSSRLVPNPFSRNVNAATRDILLSHGLSTWDKNFVRLFLTSSTRIMLCLSKSDICYWPLLPPKNGTSSRISTYVPLISDQPQPSSISLPTTAHYKLTYPSKSINISIQGCVQVGGLTVHVEPVPRISFFHTSCSFPSVFLLVVVVRPVLLHAMLRSHSLYLAA